MNTAFAKAYSIDSLGSKHGFKVNNCYVESSFWKLVELIPTLDIEEKEASILLNCNEKPALEIYFSEEIITKFKGIEMHINHVTSIRIDENFEGEETYCDITKA